MIKIKDKDTIWINRWVSRVPIKREFDCLECGKHIVVTSQEDKRVKFCCDNHSRKYISRGHRHKKLTRNKREYKSLQRDVIKEINSDSYYFIENGVKYRCSKNGYKIRELFSKDLIKNKRKGWSTQDLTELVGLKVGGLYKDKDIALLLERPISAIRNKFYTVRKQGRVPMYLEKFKKGNYRHI